MKQAPFAVLEAPSVLGLFPKGVEMLPDALIAAGLADRLSAIRAGRVEPPAYEAERDRQTTLLNPHGIAKYTTALADAIGPLLDRGAIPVVLGGDCSIMLGGLLAMRRRGRRGLLFLDAHADFYQPEAEPNGEAASMDLALATGRGPEIVTRFDDRTPLVRDDDVVVLGRRDAEDAENNGSQRIELTDIILIELGEVEREGAEASVKKALVRLTRPELDGFWLHLDADVLDDAIMPAVDYRLPGGLSFESLSTVLRIACGSGKLKGLEITIFNPKLDKDGALASQLVAAIAHGLVG